MSSLNWVSALRLIIAKIFALALAAVFLFFAGLFLLYPLVALATTQAGRDGKIAWVSDHVGGLKTGCRIGGFFEVKLADSKGRLLPKTKIKNAAPADQEMIFCLYPVWPDQLKPYGGDSIRVWPSKKPLLGEPPTDGWGWFIAATIFILGLLMLEFSFLSLTIH
jgi:hypothetical protein